MAERTSLAFSVLRFPFIAKLLALNKKIKGCQNPSWPVCSEWEKDDPEVEWKCPSLRYMDFGDTVSPSLPCKAKLLCFILFHSLQYLDEDSEPPSTGEDHNYWGLRVLGRELRTRGGGVSLRLP